MRPDLLTTWRRRRPRTDPADLLDQSLTHLVASATLQLEAKEAMRPSVIVTVGPGESLSSVLEGLAGGETVVVSPEVYTVGDLTITKPVQLIGAAIRGLVDVQAPDVYLLACSIRGSRPDGAILSTADGLTVHGCRLQGCESGQHRGIWVRSADVTILDTSVVGIWKTGQETQAIAGWSGIRRLTVRRCHLEAAGVNFMIGGSDCAQDQIPEDVIVSECYLKKPVEYRGWTGAKNLFEIKNCRRVTLENSLLQYSWVEGQVGYAILLNVRNQEGTAPWSTIEDVTIRGNTIQHVAAGMNLLGTDYTHPAQTMRRVLIENNAFMWIDPQWGANQRCLFLAHGGEDITIRRNTFSGTSINSFLTFEGAPLQRFCFDSNTVPEGSYGIKADDTALGTPTLEKYTPGCTWTNNTVQRSVASNTIPYPAGTTVVAG
jgi:hypothetical protein